jgi:putative membrane protein
MGLLAFLQQWEAAGHEPSAPASFLLTFGGWLLLVPLAGMLLFALSRHARYRALAVLGEQERERVQAAMREAEQRTVGEIVAVVLERSDAHPAANWLSALLFALVGTALLSLHLPAEVTLDRPLYLTLGQLACGLVGYLCARGLPGFQRLFVREGRATEVSEEQAFQEFYGHGLQKTEAATGVLIFVSLLERRVVVLADEGIAAKVEPELWAGVDRAVLQGVARGRLADGLVEGVSLAGEVLAREFPWSEGDRNELPDRLIVRRQ